MLYVFTVIIWLVSVVSLYFLLTFLSSYRTCSFRR